MPQLHRCDRTVNKLRSRRTAYKLRQRIAHLTSIRQHLNCQDQPGERVEKDVLLKSIFPTSDRHWIFKLCIVSSIYFFTLVFPPSSIGAVKHWSDLCRQASNFVSAGEYRQAGECYRRALDSNAKADDELVANTLLNLIECLIKTGSYREAQDSLDRANRLLVKMKREDDPIMLRLLRRSRDLNERQERYVEAAQAQSRLVSLRKQIFGSLLNPSSFAELYLLQSIQAKAKQYQESVNTGKLFVALMKEYRLSRKAPYWILVLQNNSESFIALGRFKEASDCLLEAFRIARNQNPSYIEPIVIQLTSLNHREEDSVGKGNPWPGELHQWAVSAKKKKWIDFSARYQYERACRANNDALQRRWTSELGQVICLERA